MNHDPLQNGSYARVNENPDPDPPHPPPRGKVGIWKKPWSNLEKYAHPWGCLLKSKHY